ncbi:hypothetical protein, partial [Salmonella sp. s54395]|uniref:hypothetical protein n=1 Tax=Salmonella sp. s54395 TaxID=3159664 RepID=UPI00397EC13F
KPDVPVAKLDICGDAPDLSGGIGLSFGLSGSGGDEKRDVPAAKLDGADAPDLSGGIGGGLSFGLSGSDVKPDADLDAGGDAPELSGGIGDGLSFGLPGSGDRNADPVVPDASFGI